MIMVLFCSFFLSAVYAHPFDARVVGHQMQVELRKTSIHVQYQLELPLTILRRDMLEIKEEFPDVTDSEALTLRLLEQKHSEIVDGFKIRFNDHLAVWTNTLMTQETLLQEGQFAVFRVQLDADLDSSVHQVALINQLYMDEQSIFNHQLLMSPAIRLLDTDIIPLSDLGRRQNYHGTWQSEPWLRELRLSFEHVIPIKAVVDKHWRLSNGWSELQSASEVLVPKSLRKRWLLGTLCASEAIGIVFSVILLLLLSSRYRKSPKSVAIVLGCSGPILLFGNSLQPGMVELVIGIGLGVIGLLSSVRLGAEFLCLALLLVGMSTGNSIVDSAVFLGGICVSLLVKSVMGPPWLEKAMRITSVVVSILLGIGLYLY